MSIQRTKTGETATAPRMSGLEARSCWTSNSNRLANAGVVVGLMMPAVSDDVLAEIVEVVDRERCRRAAAAA